MKKQIWIILLIAVVVAGGIFLMIKILNRNKNISYQFATVERGDLESTVSCTGTLQFLNTENVVAQVAGTIKNLYTDFNQKIRKGQVLATIDSSLLKLNVQDAESTLQKNKVLLEQSQKDYNDTLDLFTNNFKSTNDMQTADYNLRTAKLNYESAKTALDIARLNLQYATIVSPLTGIVVQRNVNIGDGVTVNNTASPVFIVASDINRMQILSSVDESDIGRIRVGQKVYFTVQAYQDKQFMGSVSQIRLQPQTVQNVVDYTVVVDVINKDNQLLPGMTATLDLVSELHTNVLKIPSSALKFRPTQDEIKKAFSSMTNAGPNGGRYGLSFKQGTGTNSRSLNGKSSTNQQNMAVLWTTNLNKGLKPVFVKKGFTDGVMVEVSGKELSEGLPIISGVQTNRVAQQNQQKVFSKTRLEAAVEEGLADLRRAK